LPSLPQAIFVRHPETAGNKSKLMKGVMDYPLDAAGKREAKKLARRVSALKPDVVISSPLKRALGPAKQIAKAAGVPLQISDEFLPIDLGALHGKKMEEGEPKLRAAWQHPDEPVADGGETPNHWLKTKVKPGFQKVKDLIAQGKRPVVVTHSRNLRNLRYGMFGAKKPSDPTTGGPEPAGFITLHGKKLQIHPDGGTSGE
jgi:broad specificity phosphatase PhoE